MMNGKILITDKVHPLLVEGLTDIGFEVNYDTSVDMTTLGAIIGLYDGIIINSKIKMYQEMIDLGTKLRFIGRLGSGMEIIDVKYASSKGILAFNTPEGNRNAVAEHAIGMMLALNNRLCIANQQVRNFIWQREDNRGFELKGKTMGIIGLGNTGESLAKKMSSWDINVISYDKYRKDYGPDLDFVRKVNLEDILNESDIITLHLPLTKETHHLVDMDFLQKCRKRPMLVNTSRGEIVKTKDLLTALDNKIIFGACLDVFENEKVETYTRDEKEMYDQLFLHKNLIVSPHIAGWTKESLEEIARLVLQKIKSAIC